MVLIDNYKQIIKIKFISNTGNTSQNYFNFD